MYISVPGWSRCQSYCVANLPRTGPTGFVVAADNLKTTPSEDVESRFRFLEDVDVDMIFGDR